MLKKNKKLFLEHTLQTIGILFFAIGLLLPLSVSPSLAVERENVLRNFSHGEILPKFTLKKLDSAKDVTFTPTQGKPAALLFFSIRPDFRKKRALALLSELGDLAEEYKNRVDIIGIYADDKEEQAVLDYMKSSAINLSVLADTSRTVFNQYGIIMMPMVIFINSDGTLHEVIPYTFNIKELVDSNLKLLLGDWTEEQFQESLNPKETAEKSKEEKEYIRRVNYGRVMVSRKMFSQAKREFTTAIKLLPDGLAAYIEMGFVHITKEEWSAAEKAFQEVLKRDKDSDDGIAGMGLTLYGRGDLDRALSHLENAFIVPKPRLEVIIALANIHEQKGNTKKAIRLNKLAVSRLMALYKLRRQ